MLRYRAFISHSHADTRWANWLHHWLESFRADKHLIGRDATGTIHTTLRPIFRHGDDFTAGGKLALAALDASHALIVICSPASAQSEHVTEADSPLQVGLPRAASNPAHRGRQAG